MAGGGSQLEAVHDRTVANGGGLTTSTLMFSETRENVQVDLARCWRQSPPSSEPHSSKNGSVHF